MSDTTAATAAPAAGPTGAINPKLIVPFIQSTKNVISTMAGLEVAVQRPHVKGAKPENYDVSGVIGFSGDIVGSVVVRFQMPEAEKIASLLAGGPLSKDSKEFPDAIGELANMVAGSAKKDFGGTGQHHRAERDHRQQPHHRSAERCAVHRRPVPHD
ncbi:MAG: chemotaxis protein CheX [Rubrivivax sp.]